MKLFYAPGSSSLLPHIVLHEAELPFELIGTPGKGQVAKWWPWPRPVATLAKHQSVQ
jgi:hypothetical protein